GREQVHVLVLDAAPQPFHEYIVQCPSLSVHTEPYSPIRMCCPVAELVGRELAPLVRVEDLRRTMFHHSGLQSLPAPVRCHGIGQRPAYYIAAVQVDY